MLACIACSKREEEVDGGGGEAATSATGRAGNREPVKSLSSQIKDMVLKFSGAYRQCKGGSSGGGGGTYRDSSGRHRTSYMCRDDTALPGGYTRATSSSSTPAWDFTSIATSGSIFNSNNGGTKWIAGVGDVGGVAAPARREEEEDSGEGKEWMAQVEPGVHITFVSHADGTGNDLKRIRFNREMFNKWQAQRWWGENYDRIVELYNVQSFSRQALATPARSDDDTERESLFSRVGSTRESPATPPFGRSVRNTHCRPRPPPAAGPMRSLEPTEQVLPCHLNPGPSSAGPGMSGAVKGEASPVDASRRTTTSSAASVSISNASDAEMTEWVEQVETGVYITVRELLDGSRELRRVRFSRERFGEVHAKLWWEENRERIQSQYHL